MAADGGSVKGGDIRIWGRCWNCHDWGEDEICGTCGRRPAYMAGTDCKCGKPLLWTRLKHTIGKSAVIMVDAQVGCAVCSPDLVWP